MAPRNDRSVPETEKSKKAPTLGPHPGQKVGKFLFPWIYTNWQELEKSEPSKPLESGVLDHIKYHKKYKNVLAAQKALKRATDEAAKAVKEKKAKDDRIRAARDHLNEKARKANPNKMKGPASVDEFGPDSSSDPFEPLLED